MLFNKAALKALEVLPFGPGTESIVVANDWHTAMLPVLVKVACHVCMLHMQPLWLPDCQVQDSRKYSISDEASLRFRGHL